MFAFAAVGRICPSSVDAGARGAGLGAGIKQDHRNENKLEQLCKLY